MTESDEGQARSDRVRSQAEAILAGKAMVSPEKSETMSHEESLRMLHELRVHQVELEVQNEELRRVQIELGAAQYRYFDLYDMAPVGYCTLSASGLILEANLHAAALFGMSRSMLGGQILPRFILTEDQGLYFHHRDRLVTSGENQTCELRMVKKDGTTFWARMSASLAKDPEGAPLCRVVLTDISAQKQAEIEKRRFDERVGHIQKLEALGILVAGIAHNLNNVLAAILAAASTRESMSPGAEDREAFRMIGAACKRGRDVLRSLLQFAKPTIEHQEAVGLKSLAEEVVKLLKNTTMNRIEILIDFPEEELWVMGDAGSLDQCLMNLGINALEAMPGGGQLVFRVAAYGPDWVEMRVEDSGCGMSPETLSQAMVPFFTTKPIGKGTGLGLSMTYGVIKAHRGTLDIDSEPGRGTAVTIRLPRIPAPIRAKPVAAPTAPLKPMDVLFVDDDEDVLFLMGDMLAKAGLRVRKAESGEAALDILRAGFLPDLVILDQNMPRINGKQTMEHIRVLSPELPILISSGQPDIEDWDCFKRPKVAVIAKPFDMDEITAKMASFSR